MITKHVLVLLACTLCAPFTVHAEDDEVRKMISDFLAVFSNREFSEFMPYFSDDATVFFPPSQASPSGRVQGRLSIEEGFKAVFARYPLQSTTARPQISPQDLLIQEFDGSAVVIFHLGTDVARQRRTFVLRRVGDTWKIVHLHGSAIGAQP